MRLYHVNDQTPYRTEYNFTNLHSARLCGPGYYACHDTSANYCEGTASGDTVDILTLQSLDSLLALDDRHWERDRIMFFENCGADCRGTPHFDLSSGTFRTAGRYRYREGTGPSYGNEPLVDWVGDSIQSYSVGHIRRYRRGYCSASAMLGAGWKSDGTWNQGIKDQVGQALLDQMGCVGAISTATLKESSATTYIGTDDCGDSEGADRDYVHLTYLQGISDGNKP